MVLLALLFLYSFHLQIRRAVLQILFYEKPFHWARHIGIAFALVFLVNVLVIFVPSMKDIFGLIGTFPHKIWTSQRSTLSIMSSGMLSLNCAIAQHA